MKKFSIIIPTYNRLKLLQELLDSMLVQQFNCKQFEFLVIDNNSTEDVEKVVMDFRHAHRRFNLKYHRESRQGVQYAWNKGIEMAQGQLLVFVDDDITFHKDYFHFLETNFQGEIKNIAGGGKVAPVFEHQKPAWISKYVMPYFAEINLGEKTNFPKKKNPLAANMLISKDVFERAGKFNTEKYNEKNLITPGTFEGDLFRRIARLNIPIYYFGDLVVWHLISKEKISKSHIKSQAIELGKTYREMYKTKGQHAYFYALLRNLLKWIAACVLSLYYIVTTQWEKASMLFKLRYWKTKGLLNF